MEPFQILGNLYIPDDEIERRIDQRRGLVFPVTTGLSPYGWELRVPTYTRSIARGKDDSKDWHRDNGGRTSAVILWTNEYPTEVLLPDGSEVSGWPYDVVLIDNMAVQHRTPAAFTSAVAENLRTNRYFIRLTLVNRPSQMQIEAWKQSLRQQNS